MDPPNGPGGPSEALQRAPRVNISGFRSRKVVFRTRISVLGAEKWFFDPFGTPRMAPGAPPGGAPEVDSGTIFDGSGPFLGGSPGGAPPRGVPPGGTPPFWTLARVLPYAPGLLSRPVFMQRYSRNYQFLTALRFGNNFWKNISARGCFSFDGCCLFRSAFILISRTSLLPRSFQSQTLNNRQHKCCSSIIAYGL